MFDVKKDLLFQILDRFSENQFLISETRVWTFRKFFGEAFLFSNFLNIKPGKKVPIFSDNPEIFLKSILALWLKRAVAVPLNPCLPFAKKKELLNKVGCIEGFSTGLLNDFDEKFSKHKYKNHLTSQNGKRGKLNLVKTKISINTKAWGTIIFTSGSSGPEKAVVHSISNHFFSALGANEFMPLCSGDRWLLSLPLYHVGGLAIFFRILLSGAAMVTSPEKENIEETIEKYKITHLSLVPTQLFRLLQTKVGRDSLVKLKLILLGGAPIPFSLLQKSSELGLNIKTTYGSTEMTSQIATGGIDSFQILPFREVRISHENEIEVRGKTLFKGYYEKEKLSKPFDKNGWFKTGDLGCWSSIKNQLGNNKLGLTNSLKIIGRLDNMFISGGENILPEEIENVLYQSKMVDQAIVVSVKDIEFGNRPVVFIKYAGSSSEAKIRKYLEKNILKFKIPDLFLPWENSFESVFKHRRKELSKIAQPKFDNWRKKFSKI